MNLILVGIGGLFGGLSRFQMGKVLARKSKSSFPIETFIINVTGALLLGLITSTATSKTVYLLLGDGFLGAYTTFSTFMYEGFNLFKGKEHVNAFFYIFISLMVGVLGYTLGFVIGNSFRN